MPFGHFYSFIRRMADYAHNSAQAESQNSDRVSLQYQRTLAVEIFKGAVNAITSVLRKP